MRNGIVLFGSAASILGVIAWSHLQVQKMETALYTLPFIQIAHGVEACGEITSLRYAVIGDNEGFHVKCDTGEKFWVVATSGALTIESCNEGRTQSDTQHC